MLLKAELGPWDLATSLNQWINEKVTRFQGVEKLDIKK